MDRSFTSSANLFPEFVFVITAMLIIYGAIFDKYEAHPVLALSAFCLSIYLWFSFQNDEPCNSKALR